MIEFLSQFHLLIAVSPMLAAGFLACGAGFVYVWYEGRVERVARRKADRERSAGDSSEKRTAAHA